MNFTCQRPYALYFILLLIPGLLVSILMYRRITKKMNFFTVTESFTMGLVRIRNFKFMMILRTIFYSVSWIFLVLAYAGISWGTYLEPVSRNGNSVSMVFDISYSMLCPDASGGLTRLQASENYASMLLSHMKDTSVSVVLAKGDGITVVPVTEDRAIVETLLETLDPHLMSSSGTSLGKGIRAALKTFPENSNRSGAVWLFTDGDETDGQLESSISECICKGVPVYIIGFGSERESSVVAGDGKTTVYTALRSEKLKRIVKNVQEKNTSGKDVQTGVFYIDATEAGSALTLLDFINKTGDVSVACEIKPVQRYELFLGLAIMFFMLAFIVTEIDTERLSHKMHKKGKTVIAASMIFTFTSCTGRIDGSKTILESTWNWYQQKYNSAVAGFLETKTIAEENGDELLNEYAVYDLACSYLMQNENEAAVSRFFQIPDDAPDSVRYAAFYNCGIIAHRQGDYESAVRFFREALKVDGTKVNAKVNLELSMLKIERNEKAKENVITTVQENINHDAMKNSVFQRIRENDIRQWKNSQTTEQLTGSQDY